MKKIVAVITVIVLLGMLFSLSGCLAMKNREILDARIVEEISYFEIEERCGKELAEMVEGNIQYIQSEVDKQGKNIDIRKGYEKSIFVIFNPDNRENLLWYKIEYYNGTVKEDGKEPYDVKYEMEGYIYKPNSKKDWFYMRPHDILEKVEIYECRLTNNEVHSFNNMTSKSFDGHFEANYDRYTKYTYYFR